ncbi:ATP-binding protein [Halorubellus sp. PRR65]|uniref:AlbA family DNA-binding domain-containing protein n=1 Tax=Halorubellus sp. PRR65 TaxID=3098148 RepID=UPI002B2625B9|nr:ATP-binding protein [Halorubellus sp. PRR65]
MDIEALISRNSIENSDVEFKHEEESHEDVVKELTAFANSGGGTIIVGVTEDSGEFTVTGVDTPQHLEEKISQTIDRRVSPRLEPTFELEPYQDETVLCISVSGGGELHSYGIDQSVFPARQGSTTTYLNGKEVRYRYRHLTTAADGQSADSEPVDEHDPEVRTLGETSHWLDRELHFIPKPDGRIANPCSFGELYLPSNPVRTTTAVNRPDMETIEHVLSCLAETFGLDNTRSHFTIEQSTGAWVGSGLSTFFDAIQSQHERYLDAGIEKPELYKAEEALYLANTSRPYPESLLLVYVEPWVSEDFARYFRIALITDGSPLDTAPLTEFGDRTEARFLTSESVDAEFSALPNPERIPFDPVTEVQTRGEEDGIGTDPVGFLGENPFHREADVVEELFGSREARALSQYEQLYAHFLQLPPADVTEFRPGQFRFIEYSKLAHLPVSGIHVDFQLEW